LGKTPCSAYHLRIGSIPTSSKNEGDSDVSEPP
jgi:hypothetical protein